MEAFDCLAVGINVGNDEAAFFLSEIFDGVATVFSAANDYVQWRPLR